MFVDLELWVNNRWQLVGRMESIGDPTRGYLGKVALEYDYDYAMAWSGATGNRALSCRYVPSFELWIETTWPAFMLDILPAGAARRSTLTRLAMADTRASDWALLTTAQFPPGNLRVCPEVDSSSLVEDDFSHEGFARSDVIRRGPDFVEYAFQRGAPIAGSTGAQGEAPKFLLCEDIAGNWHAEGALPDEQVATNWLVKFPRGRHNTDYLILAEEERYMELARMAGLRANASLVHEDGCLFVPRFDRVGGDRLGLETVASLSGISAYGVTQSLQESAKALAKYCTDPALELREFLLRDIFNLAVGNTDNHVRNTSVLKYPDGRTELSPLYDIAPMLLDRTGIPRANRWGAREQYGSVDWLGIIHDLVSLGASEEMLREDVRRMADFVGSLGERMAQAGVYPQLVQYLRPIQEDLCRQLTKAVHI